MKRNAPIGLLLTAAMLLTPVLPADVHTSKAYAIQTLAAPQGAGEEAAQLPAANSEESNGETPPGGAESGFPNPAPGDADSGDGAPEPGTPDEDGQQGEAPGVEPPDEETPEPPQTQQPDAADADSDSMPLAAVTKLVARGAEWSYRVGDSAPAAGWNDAGFDDADWEKAPAPLGYASSGKGKELATTIGYGGVASKKYITTYFRKEFRVTDQSSIRQLIATLVKDDGAVIYLNGEEVYRTNLPQGPVEPHTLAPDAVGDERPEEKFGVDLSRLQEGTNVIAAEVHQQRADSSDLFFSLELDAPPALQSGQGLLGEYYKTGGGDYGFGDYKATTIDPQINFADLEPVLQKWTGTADGVNARWTGQIVPRETGDYTFYMMGDNGFRLWIDERLVIDHWVADWDKEQTSLPVSLEGGRKHTFKIEYFEENGGSNLYLRWAAPALGLSKEIVPAYAFYLPESYAGPVSGSVEDGGNTLLLKLKSDISDPPSGLENHLTLTSGGQPLAVQSAERGADPAELKLKLNPAEPIKGQEAVSVAYDGQGGLALADGTPAPGFRFNPENALVDYSPIAIAMSLYGDAQTNRAFAWYTRYEHPEKAPADILDSIVEIVPADRDFDSADKIRAAGESDDTRVLPNLKITGSTTGSFISHKVKVDNLKPGTAYKYRVGSDGNWSGTGTFTTEGQQENDYQFLYMTDSQGSNTNDYSVWADTLKNGLEDFPNAKFLVMTGDQVDAGAQESQWLDYFGQPQKLLMNLPLMAAVGNHEGPYNDNYYYHFNYPNDSIPDPLPPGSVYSFDYGDAHIMILNTMDMNWDERQRNSFDQEVDWLKREVAQTDKKWKIVAFHKAIYSVGNHAKDGDILALREKMHPVFDELGIDVVLQGHDHTFMRSFQMYNDKKVEHIQKDAEGNVLSPNGTLYMINNSAATKFYDVQSGVDRYYADIYEQPRKAVYSGVSMTEDRFKIDSYMSGDKSPFDTYSIVRGDELPNPVEDLTADAAGGGKVSLTWTKPADKSEDDAIRGFRIYETDGKLGKNWSVYVPAAQGRDAYSYLVDAAKAGEHYTFAVRSVDKRDNSPVVTVDTGSSVPAAPTAPVVDDLRNTFGWTGTAGYDKAAEYEYSTDGGKNWQPIASNPQPVGDRDYAAGDVQVRVAADEASGRKAGKALLSDKPYTAAGLQGAYALSGKLERGGQLKAEFTAEQAGEYDGPAYLVVELMYGSTPMLINAIPIDQEKLDVTQYFNVSGEGYRVKAFVFDAFDGDLKVPAQLAEPVLLQ
ncbi:PA14 domain-containing protein [Saccharibacillus sp. CPCC 101409]|uniref:PA14 domain-containing protein n=1 Tax=Saccharibacillus sp. CPCC 101409 TaxID=3058041 RepID=UPI0026732D47|nr:PA14 domain-containing protein [Saccharibacillus sp. CPCC 101409]MDO3412602.1 PA14 domain-containing protein [Saccharibacillus sp. CPCC 101409]